MHNWTYFTIYELKKLLFYSSFASKVKKFKFIFLKKIMYFQ
jgi:hypothetical protein